MWRQITLLRVDDLSVHYGRAIALASVSLEIKTGEFIAVIGPNGAGKSTLLRAISGLVELERGTITYNDEILVETTNSRYRKIKKNRSLMPNEIVQKGVIHCPERRKLFPKLTLEENLMLGAYIYKEETEENHKRMEEVLRLFPALKERMHEEAGNFSGGQQQMIAIARSLMGRPKILMLDEPSMGLAPTIRIEIMERIKKISQQGTTILLIEQDAMLALKAAERAYILEDGTIDREGKCTDLLHNEYILETYIGLT